MTNREHLIKITRQLYPTGRAFRMANDTFLHGLHRALSISEAQVYDDADSVIRVSLIPDNSEFTSDDATQWERCLALTTNLATPLADRKLAILRKMAAPGAQKAKGHYLHLQTQLQAAGFNVWIHENLFPTYPDGYESVPPQDLYGTSNLKVARFGAFKYGQRQFGSSWNIKIANSHLQSFDDAFSLGGSLACTFFVGGQILGTYANVLSSRETEFRQLILSQKQVQTIGFLFVNYI